MYACVCIGETERGWGDTENILIHVHVTIQHRNDNVNSHSHLLLGLRGLSVQPWHIFLMKHQFLIDSLCVDHEHTHCYTGAISSFAKFFGLSPPGNLFNIRQCFRDCTESGQGLLVCTHCLNALPGLRQHSLSLAEALTLSISTVFSTQITWSVCPPTDMRFRLFDASADESNDFLSHCVLARIAVCTAKKRVLFGPHDVDRDSAHAATTLSLPVIVFEMLGSMWHST
jgi:hypothetical protein